MKILVAILISVPLIFGLAATVCEAWELVGDCFSPPSVMQDEWAWRLSSIPLAALLIVFFGGLCVVGITVAWEWALSKSWAQG